MTRNFQQILADEDNFIFTGELAARHDLSHDGSASAPDDAASVPENASTDPALAQQTPLHAEPDISASGAVEHSRPHAGDRFLFPQDSGPQLSDTLVRSNASNYDSADFVSAVDPTSAAYSDTNASLAALSYSPIFHPIDSGTIGADGEAAFSGAVAPFAFHSASTGDIAAEPHLGPADNSFVLPHSPDASGTSGLVINLIFDAAAMAAPASFRTAMEQAATILESAFNDNITLNIDVGYGEINGQALPDQDTSEGSPVTATVSYPTLLAALGDVATSTNAKNAVSSLPNTAALQGESTFYISTAQEKVFGILPGNDSAVDGWVGMGTDFTGNVLIAAALHEITHAMGRIAGGSLDLFRYNEDHSGNHVFGFGIPATPAYFSINGGTTDLADFGINSDPGDFLDPPASSLTPNDPFDETVTGTIATLTSIDDEIMNVLGFNLASTTPAATPSLPPDLIANGFSITGATSTSVSLDVTVWNYGGATAPASNTGFYLSTDSTITTADTLLAFVGLSSIPQGYGAVPGVSVALPTNLTPGEYYLGALANYDGAITEVTRSNDASNVVPIELGNSNSGNTLNVPAGVDYVFAIGANATINMGANLKAADYIAGGSGTNKVVLNGNYTGANAVTLGATTLENIQDVALTTGNSYSLTLNAATIGSGLTFELDGSALAAGNSLTFNAAAQTTGTLNLYTGNGTATLTLGGGTDTIHAGLGTYMITAGSGSDTIYFGAGFKAADSITGGSGTSVVELTGNYTGANAVTFGAATLKNISTLYLAPGNSYSLTTNAATVASGHTMRIAGSGLLVGDVLTLNDAAQTAGTVNIQAGNSAATITLGGGTASVALGSGTDAIHAGSGTYTITDGSGSDTIYFNGGFKAADSIAGGSGTSVVELSGNYTGANAVTFGTSTLTNISNLYLAPGNSYNLTLSSHTIASGQTMKIAGSGLTSTDTLTLNDGAQTAGTINIFAGNSAATITLGGGTASATLGSGTDAIHAGSGTYTITDGSGNDTIYFNGGFKAADSIAGGSGTGVVELSGNYTGANAVTFGTSTLTNISNLYLAPGNSYSLTLNADTVTSGHTMKIAASGLVAGNTLTLNGSADAGSLVVNCGAGTNVVTGGTGADTLNAGSGTDTFIYTSTTDMTSGTNYDTISGLNFATAHIQLGFAVGSINTEVTTGSLSTATFQTDLAADLSTLGAHDAVLFKPSAGTLAGQIFLVVDVNGTTGYQAGQDLVIHIGSSSGTLVMSDFIT